MKKLTFENYWKTQEMKSNLPLVEEAFKDVKEFLKQQKLL